MPRNSCLPLLVAVSLFAAACEDPELPTDPTTVVQTMTSFSATAATAVRVDGGNAFCPRPVQFDVGLVITSGNHDLFLTGIRTQFTDTSRSPRQVTLPGPVPIVQFGTALVSARSTRTFPIRIDLGCGTSGHGTLVIFADTRDTRGGTLTGTVSVPVE